MSRYPTIDDNPPDPSTEEGKARIAREAKYYEALGRFTLLFAVLETSLFAVVGKLSGAPVQMARALIGSMRANSAAGTMKRILAARSQMLEARKVPEVVIERHKKITAFVQKIFTHVSAINTMRNNLLHDGVLDPSSEAPITSKWARELYEEEILKYAVSVADIDAMSQDIRTILFALNAVDQVESDGKLTLSPEGEKLILQSAWQYKPPQPIQSKKDHKGDHE